VGDLAHRVPLYVLSPRRRNGKKKNIFAGRGTFSRRGALTLRMMTTLRFTRSRRRVRFNADRAAAFRRAPTRRPPWRAVGWSLALHAAGWGAWPAAPTPRADASAADIVAEVVLRPAASAAEVPPPPSPSVAETAEAAGETVAARAPERISPAGANAAERAAAAAADYWNRVRAAVARRLRYPEAARREKMGGRVRLRITVTDTGALRDAVSETEAAPPLLEREVRHALRRAAPFPPPPPGASRSALLAVRFDLNPTEGDSLCVW